MKTFKGVIIKVQPMNKYDEKSIVSKELFEEIFDEEDVIERSYMIAECSVRAKELGVYKIFSSVISQQMKLEKELVKASRDNNSRMTDFSIPLEKSYTNMKCGFWEADGSGILTHNVMGMEQRACHHPILPVRRLCNVETGEEKITLAFKRDNYWKEITVNKDIISSATKIVALSKYGISVTSENAKHLVKFLNDVENMNNDSIELRDSTSKLGWNGKDFIPYDSDIIFDGDVKFKQLFESINERGHEDLWIDYVRKLRATNRAEIKFMLAASFASVLIKPLGILPFFVDLWGETEGGKSVCLMLAASVWANPDASQYIGDYKSTDVALETRADMLNNLPVLLDDTSNATRKIVEDFENIIYRLCSGKGKSRSNKDLGANRENNWKCCFVTNGEKPLSDYVNQGGAINRIIEIEAGEHIFSNPSETASFLKLNYGFAGRRFVEEIKQISNLKEQYDDICQQLYSTDKMQKQAMSIACLLLADKIATETIFKDNANISLVDAKSLLIDKNELSDREKCYEYILDKVAMNASRFDATANIEKWGFVKDNFVMFYGAAFNVLCGEAGITKKAFISWMKKKKLTDINEGISKVVKDKDGNCIRVVPVKLRGMEVDENGFIKVSDEDVRDIPFD